MTWVFRWKAFGFRSIKPKNHAIFILTDQRKHSAFSTNQERNNHVSNNRDFRAIDYGFSVCVPAHGNDCEFPALD